jgi:hypothetical protein
MINTIYVDMDGVIVDFKGWISQFGTFTEDDWRNPKKAILSPWKIMEENIEECYIDAQPLDLLSKFNSMYNLETNIKFLTALPSQWYETPKWKIASKNKITWLQRYITNFDIADVIFTKGATNKITYCKPGDTLYDDRIDTIIKWNSANGIGIHTIGNPIK